MKVAGREQENDRNRIAHGLPGRSAGPKNCDRKTARDRNQDSNKRRKGAHGRIPHEVG